MEHVKGEIPDDVILNFINVTFRTVVEAYKTYDLMRLKHIIEFFIDIKSQKHQNNALTNFNYQPEVLRIISVSIKFFGRFWALESSGGVATFGL